MNIGFLNRLRSLQNLCDSPTGAHKTKPKGLLFINGPDGKNNRGTQMILKYLFHGAVGKDLHEGFIDDDIDNLDELVLLIQKTSISVLWKHDVREKYHRLLSLTPLLIEYTTTIDEESDVDSYQLRKILDFKRMIIEALPEGSPVGIPIPLGYTDIYDIESWPLMQAYAMEYGEMVSTSDVTTIGSIALPPTGFFTANYSVVDVTANLEVMLQTVDSYVVERAISTMTNTILPHSKQFLEQMGTTLCTGASEQRSAVTAEDLMSPLELLFEFGEMHTHHGVDPTIKPLMLLGADTKYIGGSHAEMDSSMEHSMALDMNGYPKDWRDVQVKSSMHCIVEACEPSSGIRWCRTYLLQRGKAAFRLYIDSLVDNGSNSINDEENEYVTGGFNGDEDLVPEEDELEALKSTASVTHSRKSNISAVTEQGIRRIESIYVKLYLALRYVVRAAFTKHSDIMEAADMIQTLLDDIMTSKESFDVDGLDHCSNGDTSNVLDKIYLRKGEVLSVHMDCLNQYGELITLDDIRDVHGVCWVYIRVAVHGLSLKSITTNAAKKQQTTVIPLGSVAVGDTFLFSACSYQQTMSDIGAYYGHLSVPTPSCKPFMNYCDPYCITHSIPYYRCVYGGGVEDASVKHLLSCIRLPRISAALGLGKRLSDQVHTNSSTSSNRYMKQLAVPMLTDNPIVSHTMATCTIYESGFIIDKMDELPCIPVIVSFGLHVDRSWVLNIGDCMEQCIRYYNMKTKTPNNLSDLLDYLNEFPLDGILVVFRMKTFVTGNKKVCNAEDGEEDETEDMIDALQSLFLDNENAEFRRSFLKQVDPTNTSKKANAATATNPIANALPSSVNNNSHLCKYMGLFFSTSTEVHTHSLFSDNQTGNPSKGSVIDGDTATTNESFTLTPNSAFSTSSSTSMAAMAGRSSSSNYTSSAAGTVNITISNIVSMWKHHLNSFNVPCYKGIQEVSLPDDLLSHWLLALDTWRAIVPDQRLNNIHSNGLISVQGNGDGSSNASRSSSMEIFETIIEAAGQHFHRQLPAQGFLPMRAHHLLADSFRLSGDRQSLKALSETPVSNSNFNSINGNVILLHGCSGNAVLHIASQLKSRLTTINKEELSSLNESFHEPHIVYLDMCDIFNSKDGAASATESHVDHERVLEALSRCKMNSCANHDTDPNALILLCLVNSFSGTHIPFDSLMQLLCHTCGFTIAMSVAVVSPSNIMVDHGNKVTHSLYHPTPTKYNRNPASEVITDIHLNLDVGIGLENLSCTTLEMCKANCCNYVIVITPTITDEYSSFRKWVEFNNPNAMLTKVSPTNMWLEDDCVHSIYYALPIVRREVFNYNGKGWFNYNSNVKLNDNSIASRVLEAKRDMGCVRIAQGLMCPSGTNASENFLAYANQLLSKTRHSYQTPKTQLGKTVKSAVCMTCISNPKDCWDITSLITVLKMLFPKTAVSNTVVTDRWDANCLSDTNDGPKQLFARAQLLATIKIFAKKQVAYTRDELNRFIKELVDTDTEVGVISGNTGGIDAGSVGSVHGIVRIKSGKFSLDEDNKDFKGVNRVFPSTYSYAMVDANESHVIIRPLLHDIKNLNGVSGDSNVMNRLYVQGSMTRKTFDTIYATLHHCVLKILPPRMLFGNQQIEDLKKIVSTTGGYHNVPNKTIDQQIVLTPLQIQAKFNDHIPLPSGCWFDGEFFIDIYGNRSILRPDIDRLFEHYIQVVNGENEKYNGMLNKIKKYL